MSVSVLSLHKLSLSREEETVFPSLPSLGGNPIIGVKSSKNARSRAGVTCDSVSPLAAFAQLNP